MLNLKYEKLSYFSNLAFRVLGFWLFGVGAVDLFSMHIAHKN